MNGFVGIERSADPPFRGGPPVGRVVDELPEAPANLGSESPLFERAVRLGIAAAREAIGDAQLSDDDLGRAALCMGCGSAGLHGNAAVHAIAKAVGVGGPVVCIDAACATGAAAIAVGQAMLSDGCAEIVLAGAADELGPITFAGFQALQALDERPCSPYSRSAGVSLGEGGAVLVLETQSSAERRERLPHACLLGTGMSSDAYHPIAPDPTGAGVELAIRRCLESASVRPVQVDYVNGHGSGSALSDSMESEALLRVFGTRGVAVSGTKSMTAHAFGATSAIESAMTCLATATDAAPPTMNFDRALADRRLDWVTPSAEKMRVSFGLSINSTFGGTNAAVAFGKSGGPHRRCPEPVVVTGIGVLGPEWDDVDGLLRQVTNRQDPMEPWVALGRPAGLAPAVVRVADPPVDEALDPRDWRRLTPLARRLLSVSRQALRDAGLPACGDVEGGAILIATSEAGLSGAELTSADLGRRLINPLTFTNSWPGSSASHLARALRFRGPNLTFLGDEGAGMGAIQFAMSLVGHGEAPMAIVCGGDLLLPASHRRLSTRRLLSKTRARPYDKDADGTAISESTLALVVEPLSVAIQRRAEIYCAIDGIALANSRRQKGTSGDFCAAVESALEANEIGAVVSSASGEVGDDAREAAAIKNLGLGDIPLTTPKGAIGDTRGASALFGLAIGTIVARERLIPPVQGLSMPTDLGIHPIQEPSQFQGRYVVVSALQRGSSSGALLLSRVGRPGSISHRGHVRDD